MPKIAFDKYYTPPTVARWCIDKTAEIIGEDTITEWFEPSAGCGMFSHQLAYDGKETRAYDLYPQSEWIEAADFLKLPLEYKKGRCFIGNPPFGAGAGKILKDFYDKCTETGDYIAFIQPASYCWSYAKFWKFEIIYSCLIKTNYTNHELWTSFTIYKRNPTKNDFRDRRDNIETLKDVTITRIGRTNKKRDSHKKNLDYDYCMTAFGQILKESKPYETSGQLIFKCNNGENKDEIISFLKWLYYYNKETGIISRKNISSPTVSANDIIRLLKIAIKGIK
jgi:predicted RNA methylase